MRAGGGSRGPAAARAHARRGAGGGRACAWAMDGVGPRWRRLGRSLGSLPLALVAARGGGRRPKGWRGGARRWAARWVLYGRTWLCTGVDRAQEVLRCTGPPVHKRSCGAPCAGSTRGGRALASRRRPDSGRSGCASAGLRHRRHGRARGCAAVWWPWLGHCGGAAPGRASMAAALERRAECMLWIGFSGRKPCRHSCWR